MLERKIAIDYLRKHGYKYDNLEDFLYKMSFFESEECELITKRTLYLSLMNLKNINYSNDEELGYAIDYMCEFFNYPEETRGLIYYMPKTKEQNGKWVARDRLEEYLDKHRQCLNLWDNANGIDNHSELLNDRFALIKNGSFKSCLITIERNQQNFSLHIWSDNIFTTLKQLRINFNKMSEIGSFLEDNTIITCSSLSDEYFLNEEFYITDFKRKFNGHFNFEVT
jgi:hypothetical protein